MRKLFLLVWMACYAATSLAQKENNIWVSGEFAGLDFNSGSPVSFEQPFFNNIWRTNASICDSNGNLLFYTNGFRVFNRNYQIMQNGDSLNIGEYIISGYDLLGITDGALIIPFSNDRGKYYLFYMDWNYLTLHGESLVFPTHIFYSVIDMSMDSGLGGIIRGEKDIQILSDTLINNGMTAVKDGNGRDSWLICHEYNSNRYYRFLIDSAGVHGPYSQNIGLIYTTDNGYGVFGNIKFNLQGSQLIKNNSDSTLFELYDFNRCTGELSNRKQIQVSDTLYFLTGLSFSPSGRYAYVSANFWTYLFQFDLQAQNIEASKKLIAIYNGALNPFQTDFYDHVLGPDNKIYICNYAYNNSLHVINSPDSPGVKCNFVQNQLHLIHGTYWGAGFPNIPNYHLGPLKGSVCDTLTTAIPPINQAAFTHGVYPNPFINKFQLSITGIDQKVTVVIYNEMGEVIFQTTLQPENGFIHGFFNLQNEPAGVYLLKAQTSRGEVTEKILKQ